MSTNQYLNVVYTTQLTFRLIISIETAFLNRILISVCLNLYLCPSAVICVTAGLEQLRSAESTLEYSPLLSKLSITLYSSRNCRRHRVVKSHAVTVTCKS